MDHIQRHVSEHDPPREGEPREILHAGRIEDAPMDKPRRGRQPAKTAARLGGNPLGDRVIVVSADGGRRPRVDPIDAGDRIGRVLDQVAEEKTRVERLLDRGERRPVRMNVGQEQNFHATRSTTGDGAPASGRRSCDLILWPAVHVFKRRPVGGAVGLDRGGARRM